MKEDILEQLVDDFLKFDGFFTMHNVKFQPSASDPEYKKQKDCVASDIDVVGINPMRVGWDRIWVVSCKSWQGGFYPAEKIRGISENRVVNGRDAWKEFRELARKKWGDALIEQISRLTGSKQFTYVTAVTKLKGEASLWETHQPFRENIGGNPIRILTLEQMLEKLYNGIKMTVAPSEIGRLIQVMKASGWTPPAPNARGAASGQN